MTRCTTCGVLDDVGEEVICEDCAYKTTLKLQAYKQACYISLFAYILTSISLIYIISKGGL